MVTDQTHGYQLQDLNYTYDDAGNVTAITDPTTLGGTSAADNQCFTYDGYRRLTNAWTPATADCSTSKRTTANLGGASPYWTSYTYTDSGLRKTETAHTTSADTTKTYCYSTTKLHQLAATTNGSTCTGVTPTYVYDDTGNTTTRLDGTATQSLAWDNESRLSKLVEGSSTTGYVYDADGSLLIRRNTAGETVLYLGATEVHLDTSTTTTKYWAQRYYSAGSAAIAVRSNKSGTSTLSYLAADQHGTSTLALEATTQAITKRYTTPFGASRTGGTGTWPDDKSFLGKIRDSSSGLTHIGAREYDPVLARFISVDPLLETDKPQTLNGYTYGNNNPATFSDPTGEGLACGAGFAEGCGNGVVTHGDGSTSKNGNPTGGGVAPGWNTGTAPIISTGSLFGDTDLATPGPYFDPKWAEDPVVMAWATSNQKGPLANALYGVGLPVASALDIAGIFFTPACIVEDQCLADRYVAWGKEHGFNADGNAAGVGAAAGAFLTGGGKGKSSGARPEEVPVKPGYKPAPFNPDDPYSPESVKKRQTYNKQLYPITNADRAAELGYHTAIKANRAPFKSHGQDVFFNGKNYITPDVDGHNVTDGWKMFNRQGRRIGTYDPDLNYLKP